MVSNICNLAGRPSLNTGRTAFTTAAEGSRAAAPVDWIEIVLNDLPSHYQCFLSLSTPCATSREDIAAHLDGLLRKFGQTPNVPEYLPQHVVQTRSPVANKQFGPAALVIPNFLQDSAQPSYFCFVSSDLIEALHCSAALVRGGLSSICMFC